MPVVRLRPMTGLAVEQPVNGGHLDTDAVCKATRQLVLMTEALHTCETGSTRHSNRPDRRAGRRRLADHRPSRVLHIRTASPTADSAHPAAYGTPVPRLAQREPTRRHGAVNPTLTVRSASRRFTTDTRRARRGFQAERRVAGAHVMHVTHVRHRRTPVASITCFVTRVHVYL